MRISQLKPFIPKENIIVPPRGNEEGKRYCFIHLSENVPFNEVYRHLGIRPNQVKYVMVPTTVKPITRLTQDLRKIYINHKLIPVKMKIGNYEKFYKINYFLEYNMFLDAIIKRWNLNKFNTKKSIGLIKQVIDTISGIPADTHERILLYTVNLNKDFPRKIYYRKIFPILYMFLNKENIPFDKLLMFYYNEEGGRYVLLYDKDRRLQPNRIKSFLLRLSPGITSSEELEDIHRDITDTIDKEEYTDSEKEKLRFATQRYIANTNDVKAISTPEESDSVAEEEEHPNVRNDAADKLLIKSIAYHKTGDEEYAKKLADALSPLDRKSYINKNIDYLPKKKVPFLEPK